MRTGWASSAAVIFAWLAMTVPFFKSGATLVVKVSFASLPAATVPTCQVTAPPLSVPPSAGCTSTRSGSRGSLTTTPLAGWEPVFFTSRVHRRTSPGSTFPPLTSVTVLVDVERSGMETVITVGSPGAGVEGSSVTAGWASSAAEIRAWFTIRVPSGDTGRIRAVKWRVTSPPAAGLTFARGGVVAGSQTTRPPRTWPPSAGTTSVRLGSMGSTTFTEVA